MNREIELVEEFHRKYKVLVSSRPTLIPDDRANNRYNLMESEVKEYREGAENADLEYIAKELADILYAVYGTIIEYGLQQKMPEIFAEVHRSNMSKDYHEYKMIKGEGYFEADISSVLR